LPGSEVIVTGLGPAGATLALELARRGFTVEGFDVTSKYRKACGNTTPREGVAGMMAEYFDAVISEVSEFEILAEGKRVASISTRRPLWLVIDKSKLIASLREAAEAEGARISYGPLPERARKPGRESILVDARGPYAYNSYILVYRIIARANEWSSSSAVIDFQVGRGGLYWIFPAGDGMVNAGVGFVRSPPIRRLREALISYLNSRLGTNIDVVEEGAAPLAITAHPRLYDSKKVYVGEAAGLVNALSGEGVRQAILSAQRLSQAIELCGLHKECSRSRYRTYARTLELESRLSRLLLRLVLKASPSRGISLLESLSEGFWIDFLSGKMMRALARTLSSPSSIVRTLALSASALAGSTSKSRPSSQV
jgi:flavin-dependent dehydrogenase